MKSGEVKRSWRLDDVPKTKLGIIGAGTHAANMLIPSLNFLDFAERTAVCDLSSERASYIAKRFGFEKSYSDYNEMFQKEKLDGVIVCINAGLHPKVVKDCMDAGLDVLVEKPAAVTPEEAEELWNLSREKQKIIMVDHQKRGSIAYSRAMDLVNDPEFGEIMNIEVKSHAFPYDSLFNCLMEWDIHAIDIMLAFGGEVEEICAKCKYLAADHERASIAALVKFKNGVVGTINLGTEGNSGNNAERLEVVGSNLRTVIVDNARKVTCVNENELEVWESDWKPISENMTHVLDGYVLNIYKFCKGIHTRQAPKPSIYDEWQALKFIYEVAGQCGIEKKWKMVIGER